MSNNKTAYPDPRVDTDHADSDVLPFFEALFAAKNGGEAEPLVAHFSADLVTYTDAPLGWENTSFAAVKAVFEQFVPSWGAGRAYPVRIIGGPNSAIVAFTDTPELFGDEIHGLGAIDLADRKVVRWVDYWDSTSFNRGIFDSMAASDEAFPVDFHEGTLSENAVGAIRQVVSAFHAALSTGDAEAAGALFAFSARFEDQALRTLITGKAAITRYIARMRDAPYGLGSRVRHILGGPMGGGYEWVATPSSNVRAGITAIELDNHGLISRLTTLYDAHRLPSDLRRELVLCSQDF